MFNLFSKKLWSKSPKRYYSASNSDNPIYKYSNSSYITFEDNQYYLFLKPETIDSNMLYVYGDVLRYNDSTLPDNFPVIIFLKNNPEISTGRYAISDFNSDYAVVVTKKMLEDHIKDVLQSWDKAYADYRIGINNTKNAKILAKWYLESIARVNYKAYSNPDYYADYQLNYATSKVIKNTDPTYRKDSNSLHYSKLNIYTDNTYVYHRVNQDEFFDYAVNIENFVNKDHKGKEYLEKFSNELTGKETSGKKLYLTWNQVILSALDYSLISYQLKGDVGKILVDKSEIMFNGSTKTALKYRVFGDEKFVYSRNLNTVLKFRKNLFGGLPLVKNDKHVFTVVDVNNAMDRIINYDVYSTRTNVLLAYSWVIVHLLTDSNPELICSPSTFPDLYTDKGYLQGQGFDVTLDMRGNTYKQNMEAQQILDEAEKKIRKVYGSDRYGVVMTRPAERYKIIGLLD